LTQEPTGAESAEKPLVEGKVRPDENNHSPWLKGGGEDEPLGREEIPRPASGESRGFIRFVTVVNDQGGEHGGSTTPEEKGKQLRRKKKKNDTRGINTFLKTWSNKRKTDGRSQLKKQKGTKHRPEGLGPIQRTAIGNQSPPKGGFPQEVLVRIGF